MLRLGAVATTNTGAEVSLRPSTPGLGAVVTANAGVGGRRDRRRWGWGLSQPSMLGLGMAAMVVSAGACKKKTKKEIWTYLPGAQGRAQTKRMGSRAAQARLTSAYMSVAVGTAQEDLEKCQQAQTYLPEVHYHTWWSQKGPETKQTRRACTHAYGVMRKPREGLQTRQNALKVPKTTWNPYSPGNRAQRSHKGPGTTRMHRADARTSGAIELTQKWL